MTCLATSTITILVGLSYVSPAWGRGRHYLDRISGIVSVGQGLPPIGRATEYRYITSDHNILLLINGRVRLNCADGSSSNLNSAGIYKVERYCGPDRRPGARRSPPRGDAFNANLPYLLTPRNTALLSASDIKLRWNAVSDAESYRVEISRPLGAEPLQTEVDAPHIDIPENEGFLPDYVYGITIRTLGSQEDDSSSASFSILPLEEAQRVREQVTTVKNRGLNPDVEASEIAFVYLDYEHTDPDRRSFALNQNALDVLETRIQSGTENSQIYLLQADTYMVVGLLPLAEERYRQALTFAERNVQLEVQAQAHVGIANIAERQTDYIAAVESLNAAQTLYEELGDRAQVDILRGRTERISTLTLTQ